MPSHCFRRATGYLLFASLARHKWKNWFIHTETSAKSVSRTVSPFFVLFNLARQIGADDGAAAEHDTVAARHLFNTDIVFEAEHVAVGGYGDGDVFADFAYPFPMRGWFVAFDFGARVYGQGAGPAFGDGGGTFEREAFVFVTEPHFAGKRDVFGQALAQGFDDMVDEVGLSEQDAPPLCLLTVGAGQPKLRSILSAPKRTASKALTAILSASLPKSWTVQGVPAGVLLPLAISGAYLSQVEREWTVWVMRTNSLTHSS